MCKPYYGKVIASVPIPMRCCREQHNTNLEAASFCEMFIDVKYNSMSSFIINSSVSLPSNR